jgi:putative peptidoglycan binding protein
LADQPPLTAIRLPLVLEVSVDLNEFMLSQIMSSDGTLSMLTAPDQREGKYWLLSYRIEEMVSPPVLSQTTRHDVRSMAIEAVLTSQVMYRFGKLINEVIDVEVGNQSLDPNRYSFDPARSVYLLTPGYLEQTFTDLISPLIDFAVHEHVSFEVIGVEPGSTKTTLAVLLTSASLTSCTTAVENIDRVASSVGKHTYDAARIIMKSDEQDERRKVFREALRDGIIADLKKGNAKSLQQALKSLGHDPGRYDGIIGPRTIAALRAFEKENNLPELDPKNPALAGYISDAIAVRMKVHTNPLF